MTDSWDIAEKWYNRIVGEKGHDYHQSVVLPNAIRMLKLPKSGSLLDLGCGQGVLSRALPESIEYCGIDLSKKLIQDANLRSKRKTSSFYVGDATAQKLPIEKDDFDRVACILSLQNMENGERAIQTAARHLKNTGELLLVLNHPCFRIPRQSDWGIDEKAKLQFRKVNCYLTSLKIPLQVHPGKGEKSAVFYSYHNPLSVYMQWLANQGFAITAMEEWVSHKNSTGLKSRIENRARREIPLFLAIKSALFKNL
ncbi:MAG TPA: class I SAM-dependent methyltransferase [Chlamydiales bacterium]|nr:class I SAM-dependent methyltransferase [Chlamydiales bacterium]